ncbi:SGNH hydrolase-type esterase domain-containing protein [Plasmodiophora brassicae]
MDDNTSSPPQRSRIRLAIVCGATVVALLTILNLGVSVPGAIVHDSPIRLGVGEDDSCRRHVADRHLLVPLPSLRRMAFPELNLSRDAVDIRIGTCMAADRVAYIWVERRHNGTWTFLYGSVLSVIISSPLYRRAVLVTPDSLSVPVVQVAALPPGTYRVDLVSHGTNFVPIARADEWSHKAEDVFSFTPFLGRFPVHPGSITIPGDAPDLVDLPGDNSWRRSNTSEEFRFRSAAVPVRDRRSMAQHIVGRWVVLVGDSTMTEATMLMMRRMGCTVGDIRGAYPHPWGTWNAGGHHEYRMFDTEWQAGAISGDSCPMVVDPRTRLTHFYDGGIDVFENYGGSTTMIPPTPATDRFLTLMGGIGDRKPDVVIVNSGLHDHVHYFCPKDPAQIAKVIEYRQRYGAMLDFVVNVTAPARVIMLSTVHIARIEPLPEGRSTVNMQNSDVRVIEFNRIARDLARERGLLFVDRWAMRLSVDQYETSTYMGQHCADQEPPEKSCWATADLLGSLI